MFVQTNHKQSKTPVVCIFEQLFSCHSIYCLHTFDMKTVTESSLKYHFNLNNPIIKMLTTEKLKEIWQTNEKYEYPQI